MLNATPMGSCSFSAAEQLTAASLPLGLRPLPHLVEFGSRNPVLPAEPSDLTPPRLVRETDDQVTNTNVDTGKPCR